MNIKRSLNKIIDSKTWIDGKTKSLLKTKVDRMRSVVGYPDILMNDTFMETFHENIIVNESDYLGTVVNVTKEMGRYMWRQLRVDIRDYDYI